jgi:branched-chain amino acid transport system substrate-binding protein/urea transport system substrate-binding protein
LTHYNALMALKAGLEKAGRIDREAVIEGLEGLSFDSPTGSVTIDADHHHATLSMYLASSEGSNLKEIRALGHLASRPGC